MTFYEIDGVVPAADPSAYVHPLASVIGDVIIGPGCYVGPGASLRGIRAGTTVPPRSLVVGNPAKILRELDTETVQWKRNGVHVYQELARRSRSGLRAVDPLPAPEPDRPRVSTDSSVSRPLHEMRAEWGAGTPPSTRERMSDAVK